MNFKSLDCYLDRFYREKNIPGLGISIYKDGKQIHMYCTGFADVEKKIPFAQDTMINLYSATKLSTCTAALRLVEKGLIRLTDPVEKYLPEMAGVKVRQENSQLLAPKNKMLIRHLFSMSAGFSYGRDLPALRELLIRTNGRPTTRQAMEALAKEPLLFESGSRFQYSFCHDVLGALMEVVCGDTLDHILRRELFDPMDMPDTSFHLNEQQRKRLAPEYSHFNGKNDTADAVTFREGVDMGLGPVYESGGGGLISCVRDYGKLAAMLANGGIAPNGKRILSADTIAKMQENQLTEEGKKDFEAFGGWSKAGYGYGLGVRVLMDRERNNSLSENGELGWDGALGCYFASDPKSGIAIFYAQQEEGSKWYEYHGMIRNYVYACILGSEERNE